MKTCTKCAARPPLWFFQLINSKALAACEPKPTRKGGGHRTSIDGPIGLIPCQSTGFFWTLHLSENKAMKLVCKVISKFRNCHKLQLEVVHLRHGLSYVVTVSIRRTEITCSVDNAVNPGGAITDISSMANQVCKICPQTWGQRVDAVLSQFCARQKRNIKISDCGVHCCCPSHHTRLKAGFAQRLGYALQSNRKPGDFVQEKPADDPRGFLPESNCLPMLLCRDLRRLLSDLRCSFGRSLCDHRHDRGCYGGTDPNQHRCPIGHVSPVRRKQAIRHPLTPLSMLEPILP